MRFAYPWWLFGIGLGVVVAIFLILGGVKLMRSLRSFGDSAPVATLITARAGNRRAVKGGLLVLAVMLAFVALSGPQYGRGTRLLPATNLDVVIVLDYSKSMYARDVAPSRSERAKIEVSRLIHELAGARFGAVAFAGEPLSFPLTSDGGAISQFFRQLSPNDMPVGGTAIARALEAARGLFERDPLSARHQKVVLLVTDGEDLEGDPIAVAKTAAGSGIVVHVVQIGGRTPEPIPNVGDDGTLSGIRTDSDGKPLTTSLTADGEAQLAEIAKAGNGNVVRAAEGETGIDIVTRAMKRMMTEELSEKVETVYADVFWYPLGLCLLLLLIETLSPETPRPKKRNSAEPQVPSKPSKKDAPPSKPAVSPHKSKVSLVGLALLIALGGCERIEKTLFSRHSPEVDQAITFLEKGDAGAASGLLETYLSTGACNNGDIGTPDTLRNKPQASFDLGLALFKIGERFGARFGEDPLRGGTKDPAESQLLSQRSQEVDCALRVVRIIAADTDLDPVLRASAYYLSGNLEFLRHDYQKAVDSYDACLKLVPGEHADAGATVGRDAAYNRAIALRRIEEQENDEPDAGPPPPPSDGGAPEEQPEDDSKQDQKQDDQKNQEQEQKQDEPKDPEDQNDPTKNQEKENSEQNDNPSADGQDPQQPEKQPGEPESTPREDPSSPSLSQDQRILDGLEEAPTLQQEAARKQRGRAVRGMEDK